MLIVETIGRIGFFVTSPHYVCAFGKKHNEFSTLSAVASVCQGSVSYDEARR